MGLRFKEQDLGECFFITTSFQNHRELGEKPGVYDALAASLNYRLKKTESRIIAYVLMPSHIHLILVIIGAELANFMRDFKKYTAQKTISDIIGSNKIWEDRYDRQAIWTEKILRRKIKYIHENPVRSGLAVEPELWYYSSAADFAGRNSGPVEIWKEWYL